MKGSYWLAMFIAATAFGQAPPDKPMEQTKKNIKVLTGVPSSQLIPIMTVMANSIGVTCLHCHEQAWESDAKPAKEATRRMIRLVRSINDTHYEGKTVVTCNTCHHGRVATTEVPSIADAGYLRIAQTAVAATLPSADDLFAKYTSAWGNVAAVNNRLSRGLATAVSGRAEPRSSSFELFQERPDTADLKVEVPYPPEANRELRAQFFNQLNIRERYSDVRTIGVDRVRGRDAYVVEAVPKDKGRAERLFFDNARGVLVRRVRETPTLVGPLPEQYDYDDYRTVDGVLVPFLLQWSRGDYQITHRVAEVKHDVAR